MSNTIQLTNNQQLSELMEQKKKILLATVPQEYRTQYIELIDSLSDLGIKRAVARSAPYLFRHRPEHFEEYKELLLKPRVCETFAENLQFAFYRLDNIDPYIDTIKKFSALSKWVTEHIIKYLPELLERYPEKLEEYKKVIHHFMSQPVLAGELTETLARFYQWSDKVDLYVSILEKMTSMWQSIEVAGYIPDSLEHIEPEKRTLFLEKINTLAQKSPKAAAFASRIKKVKKEEPSVLVNDVKHIQASYDRLTQWSGDPKGHFDITVFHDEQTIQAKHYENCALKHVIEGDNAFEIYNTIHDLGLVSRLDHSSWVGSELARAENALILGLLFEQDIPLDINRRWS